MMEKTTFYMNDGVVIQYTENGYHIARRNTMARTILVVDDKSSMRQLIEEYLSEQGFRVVTAGTTKSI